MRVLGPEVAARFARLHREHGVDVRVRVSARGDRAGGGRRPPAPGRRHGRGGRPRPRRHRRRPEHRPGGGRRADRRQRHPHRRAPAHLGAGRLRGRRRRQRPAPGARSPLRVEHWDNAIRQGVVAARNLLGQQVPYARMPYFFSDQYDLGLEYVGGIGPDGYDEVVVRGEPGAAPSRRSGCTGAGCWPGCTPTTGTPLPPSRRSSAPSGWGTPCGTGPSRWSRSSAGAGRLSGHRRRGGRNVVRAGVEEAVDGMLRRNETVHRCQRPLRSAQGSVTSLWQSQTPTRRRRGPAPPLGTRCLRQTRRPPRPGPRRCRGGGAAPRDDQCGQRQGPAEGGGRPRAPRRLLELAEAPAAVLCDLSGVTGPREPGRWSGWRHSVTSSGAGRARRSP